MLGNSEASIPGDRTPQSLIHQVVVNHNACVLKDELHKTNSASHQEQVASIATKANRENEVEQQPTVCIPDMFVCFCSLPPALNRHYDPIKRDSDTFIRTVSGFNERETELHIKADFAYLGAILVPDARPEEFRVVCDWLNWVFDWDDPFDEGALKDRPEEAKELVDKLLATMESTSLEDSEAGENVLVEVFRSIWLRLVRTASRETQRRFMSSTVDYCNGLIKQTQACVDANEFDLNAYLARKCQTVATYPLYAMVEYCYDLELSDEVIACESIQTIERLSAELTGLQNDVLSYHKEKHLGFEHNLVGIYIRQGKTQTEAYECVNKLIEDRYRAWYLALAKLPMWGEDIDKQVQVYIQGCQNMVVANLNWSFRTERYFSEDHLKHTPCKDISLSHAQRGIFRLNFPN